MPQPFLDKADLAACRALLCGGSRSFHAASLLLPRRVHEPATALYAFCRVADDLIDGASDGGAGDGGAGERGSVGNKAGAALTQLTERLDAAYAGRPLPHAADRALAAVVARFAIPRALLDALLEGFAWDAAGRRYEDLAALEAYAARVAGAVGAVMALLMGERSAAGVARACDLGAAMQLSNIARDVGEDARAGRLYLPLDWLRAAGIDPDAWLARPVHHPALAGVVAQLLARADVLYRQADAGIAALPATCRPGIRAARHLYAGIGAEVARRGFDGVTTRAVVPGREKLRLLGRALLPAGPAGFARWGLGSRPRPSPLAPCGKGRDATQFLVQAVLSAAGPVQAVKTSRWQALDDRAGWLLTLFGQLDARQTRGRS